MTDRLTSFAGFAAPLILILSPVLSYTDQAYSMHREQSSKGFSLDIPLIMLVASLLRYCFFALTLEVQALCLLTWCDGEGYSTTQAPASTQPY